LGRVEGEALRAGLAEILYVLFEGVGAASLSFSITLVQGSYHWNLMKTFVDACFLIYPNTLSSGKRKLFEEFGMELLREELVLNILVLGDTLHL